MAGRTISAHADSETAQLVEQISRMEGRTPSQIAASALALYVRLPGEAHSALRQVQAFGEPEDLREAMRQIARVLLHAQYEIGRRRLVASIPDEAVEHLETEEDIVAEAVRLTARKPASLRRAGGNAA